MLLLSPTAGDLLTAVLAPAGGRPAEWSIAQVDGATVSYAARVEWADGSVTNETLGAAAGRLPDGVARVSNGDTEIGMWRFPFDPDLPGLPAACDPARLARLVGLPVSSARLRVRSYRPRRRAVVELTTSAGTVFVKVVRPNKVEHLHELHRIAFSAGCPTPEPLGWTADGLLVLAGLPGETLRARLLSGKPAGLAAADVVAVLDTLPFSGPARQTWGQKAPHYAEVIAETVPSLAPRARAIAAVVDHSAPEGPLVPVHGDFYEAQLLVRDGRSERACERTNVTGRPRAARPTPRGGVVSGLLDIDTAGTGERVDDAACLLAHLSVLAQLHPGVAGVIDELELALRRRFAVDLDPAVLARRTAAVVLSLATGPHRVHEPGWRQATGARLDLAERWLGECPQ